MENILRGDVVFKLQKTRQKLALSLTPLGAVRAAAEGTGYKNRHLGKPRGVRLDSSSIETGLVCTVRYALSLKRPLSLPARTSGNTHAVSLLHASLWVQLL